MRLSPFERESILQSVREHLPDARVLLFGSRTDDTKRGGDIDLLVLINAAPDWRLKWQISEDIQQLIGEQKIDVLVEDEANLSLFAKLIFDEALPLET